MISNLRYVYNTSGYYVAFLQAEQLFTPDCCWLGVLKREEVYNTAGIFVGFLRSDDRVIRDRTARLPKQILRPITPLRPIRPLPPKRHLFMPALSPPLEDVFEGLRRPLTALTPLGRLEQLDQLYGCTLVAADGTLLGTFSRDRSDEESLADPAGPYGSPAAEGSIFNVAGPYGSATSPLSPFDPTSTTAPRIERDGEVVAYLSANPEIPGRVDPNELLSWLTMR